MIDELTEIDARVAAAIEGSTGVSLGTFSKAKSAVCAVLRVLREPTKDMILEGKITVDNNVDETSDSYSTYKIVDGVKIANAVWRAMIDRALEGK